MRDVLPDRRASYTQRFRVDGTTVHLCCGLYDDNRLGEVFIDLSKQGQSLRFWGHATATLFSIALQCGAPLQTLVDLFLGVDDIPNGPVTGHPRITRAASIMDAIVRSLAIDFLNRQDLADVPLPKEAK